MSKQEELREEIVKHTSEMLDNPDEYEIYPTTKFYNNLEAAITKLFLESLPERIYKTPGKGCICHARSESECGCEADWTDYSAWNDCLDQITKEFRGETR